METKNLEQQINDLTNQIDSFKFPLWLQQVKKRDELIKQRAKLKFMLAIKKGSMR